MSKKPKKLTVKSKQLCQEIAWMTGQMQPSTSDYNWKSDFDWDGILKLANWDVAIRHGAITIQYEAFCAERESKLAELKRKEEGDEDSDI